MSEKDKHIDWMNEQDAALTREAKQHDFAGEVELEEVYMEDFGWAGDSCWSGESLARFVLGEGGPLPIIKFNFFNNCFT